MSSKHASDHMPKPHYEAELLRLQEELVQMGEWVPREAFSYVPDHAATLEHA